MDFRRDMVGAYGAGAGGATHPTAAPRHRSRWLVGIGRANGASAELQAAFIHRLAHGGLQSQQGAEARRAAETMQGELKKLIRDVHPADYIEAQKFLRSNEHEVLGKDRWSCVHFDRGLLVDCSGVCMVA